MDRMLCVACLVAGVLAAAPTLAVTPISSPSILTAIRTGEVIGSAEACGVPIERLVEVGQAVIARVRDRTRASSEVQQVQTAHETAVVRGSQKVTLGRQTCAKAMQEFRALERER